MEENCQQTISQHQKPELYYGFDLSKATFEAGCRQSGLGPVQCQELQKIKTLSFKRTRKGIEQWWQGVQSGLKPGQRVAVVMEVTSSFSLETAVWLKTLCPQVQLSILSGKRVRDWAQGIGIDDKTDRIDARVLACYGAERQPQEYVPLQGIYAQIRPLSRARLGFVEQLVAVRQQLEEACKDHVDEKIAKQLKKLYQSVIRALQKQIEQAEAAIRKLVEQDTQLSKDVALLDTIAGVGWLTAITILAELGDLRRFGKRSQVAAMAGLNPVVRSSGTSVHARCKISKKGSSRGRRTLYLATLSTLKGQNMFSAMYNALVQRGKKKMVAIAAVMRKMLLVMRAVLISGKAFDPLRNAKAK